MLHIGRFLKLSLCGRGDDLQLLYFLSLDYSGNYFKALGDCEPLRNVISSWQMSSKKRKINKDQLTSDLRLRLGCKIEFPAIEVTGCFVKSDRLFNRK